MPWMKNWFLGESIHVISVILIHAIVILIFKRERLPSNLYGMKKNIYQQGIAIKTRMMEVYWIRSSSRDVKIFWTLVIRREETLYF